MSLMVDMLASFPTDFRALVFGARGGLGAHLLPCCNRAVR